MSPRTSSIAISTGLIGSGAVAWALAARPLATNRDLVPPCNPFGLDRSPYGEVLAMAMQGSIDNEFHVGVMGGLQHKHQDAKECENCDKQLTPSARGKSKLNLKARYERMLASLNELSQVRTNPKPAGKALRLQVRREAEDKLRFAYQLDPSNYANYNSLHFFLTEPSVGTRPELTPSAKNLADETIAYCLKQENDPRPALTAAAACTNILHLMFDDRRNKTPKYNTAQMRETLDLLDHCLARYDSLSRQWDESKNWDLLSPQRIDECEERSHFIRKIRDAAEKTIRIYEGETVNHQAAAN